MSDHRPSTNSFARLSLQFSTTSLQANDSDSDQFYGGYSDRSIELDIMHHRHQTQDIVSESLTTELSIVEYLKGLKLRFQTDPLAKKDKYYAKKQHTRQTKRAQTLLDSPTLTTMTPPTEAREQPSLQMCSILMRRTPQSSLNSSPLIEMYKNKRPYQKSHFGQSQKQKSPGHLSSGSEEDF